MTGLARRLCAYAFLEDLILLYPVYALLFAGHGLSAAEISTLFIIWSCVTFVVEIPSGLWADLFSRRLLLTLSPLVTGAGYALWTWLPSYPAFAAGFVLWGVGSSLCSGTLQALVYEELERWGRAGSYARLMGRSQALGTTAVMAATALAGPVLHLGGYAAVGAASVAVCVLGALVGRSFPESRGGRDQARTPDGSVPRDASRAGCPAGAAGPDGPDGPGGPGGSTASPASPASPASDGWDEPDEPDESGFLTVLRAGLGELRGSRPARNAVLLTSAVTGALMIDEYVPLLIGSMDVGVSTVPLLILLVTVGVAVGGWCAGRGARLLGPALAVGALALAAGALTGPAGAGLLALAFGVFQWATVTCDAMLQGRLSDRARATVSSVAGFGAEVVSVLLCAGYALGSQLWAHSTLFVLAAVPYVLIALVLLWNGSGRRRGSGSGSGRERGRERGAGTER
ncbi:MFS transporter [Streptomyces sp. WMMB 322]|uniref:MFS transporter n=1 Tax=Streptomyces sp. WMMB 322 TaxID=1286821 RepID=UPI0006E29541|nr:MFS transporter [Streptomyces sp. WMMB 322]SCK42827.1 Major Facilitator Superfamily protein [Streptomyces sp. WMMB 322]